MNQKIMITGTLFVLVFLFGYWLSRLGRPYNTLIFTVHKLIGLAMGIFLIVTAYRSHQTVPLNAMQVISLTITALIFIALVAAGALLSIDAAGDLGGVNQATLTAISLGHKFLPYLAVLSTAATLYLLLSRQTQVGFQ